VVEERTSVAMLGLPGFRLFDATEVDGELEYVNETLPTLVGCTTCGTLTKAKDRRDVVLRDLPHGEWPVRLRWRKRVWSCPDPDCPARTWTEESWLAAQRRHLTERARAEICHRVGEENVSVARCAQHFGVGRDDVPPRPTAAAVARHRRGRRGHRPPPRRLHRPRRCRSPQVNGPDATAVAGAHPGRLPRPPRGLPLGGRQPGPGDRSPFPLGPYYRRGRPVSCRAAGQPGRSPSAVNGSSRTCCTAEI
jgi:hypothetical protein